ncbi:PaaI family thioesterase [Oxalobacteraceae bacterium CAVE-383]|nr:PaaI family thioesterase [Oxalobacteraceae bacterium CAVE-383]
MNFLAPANDFFPRGNPFLESLGVEVLRAADGVSELALILRPDHMNSWHVTHGGVSMTLIDVAMALAGRSLNPGMRSCVTVDLNTQFLQPGGKPGDRLVAIGKAFHRSSTMCFCEAEIRNGDSLVVRGTGTFKYLKQLDNVGRLSTPGGRDDA